MKNNKKALKVVLYISIFLLGVGFITFPHTFSYFKHKEDGTLVYKAQLYNLYDEYTMKLESAKMDTAKFSFTFLPSKATLSNETDAYEIIIPDVCTFDSISGESSTMDKNVHSYTVRYPNGSDRETTRIINMTCPIDINSDMVKFVVKINGMIDGENHKFAYIKYTYQEKYTDYMNHVEEKVELSKTFSSKDIYNNFMKWIMAYAKYVGFENEIRAYVVNTYPDEKALINLNNSLLGLSVEYNKSKDEYTFKILENFVGYARTFYNNFSSSETIRVFFSTTSKDILNQAFKNYLNFYVYPNSTSSANAVYDYVYNNKQIYSVIFENNFILGLEFDKNNSKNTNTSVLVYKSILLSKALNFQSTDGGYSVAFGGYYDMLYEFSEGMKTTYAALLSNDIRSAIYRRTEIKASVTKNANADINDDEITTPKKAFTDYFIQESGTNYLLIKISSNPSNDSAYNKVEISPFMVPEGAKVTFANTDDKVTIQMSYTSKDSVMQMVKFLNGYFNTSITENDVRVISSGSTYTIEYTITK